MSARGTDYLIGCGLLGFVATAPAGPGHSGPDARFSPPGPPWLIVHNPGCALAAPGRCLLMSPTGLGTASLRVLADTSSFESSLTKSMSRIGKLTAGLFAGAALTKGVGFLKDAVTQASNLNESLDAVRVVLGDNAGAFLDWSDKVANSLGSTNAELNQLVTPIAAILGNSGFTGAGLEKNLETLTLRAADAASVFNTSMPDALAAFQSALKGEYDPIEKYGVRLSAAAVAQEAVREGLAKNKSQVSQSAKTQAAYNLLLQQTSKYSGDLANTQNSFANKTRSLSAEFRQAKIDLGSALLPAMQQLQGQLAPLIPQLDGFAKSVGPKLGSALGTALQYLPAVVGYVKNLWDDLTPLVGVVQTFGQTALPVVAAGLGLFEAVLGPAVGLISTLAPLLAPLAAGFLAYAAAAKVAAIVQGILDAELVIALSPFALVAAAVAVLAAGFVYAWQHSEKFRDIVTKVFNGLVDTVGFAVKALVDTIFYWGEAPLIAIDDILKALSHLPSYLGGGVAGDAEGAVSALLGHIEDWRKGAIDKIDDVIAHAKLVPAFADPTGLANADFGYGDNAAANITAELIKQGIGGPAAPKVPTPSYTVPTGGGSGGSGSAAASTAKAAAATLKANLKTQAKDVAKFAGVTGKTTADQISAMIAKVKADYKALGKSVPASLVKVEKSLLSTAKAQAKNSTALKAAKDSYKSLQGAAADYVATLAKSTTLDITSSSSVEGLKFRQGQMLARTQAFVADIRKLAGEHLSPALLRQLIDAGPLNGFATADALANAGLSDLAGINSVQSQLEGLGDQLGQIGYDQFFKSGVDAAAGIVAGLQSQDSVLTKAMTTLGDQLAKAFAKSIKAHSPSRVFAELGGYIPQGIAQGIGDNSHHALSALSGLGDSMGLAGAAMSEGANGIAGGGTGPIIINANFDLGDGITQRQTIAINRSNRKIKSASVTGSASGVVRGMAS